MSFGPTKPKEILKFLLGNEREPYPFARAVSLLTFCTWMRWPNDPEVVQDAHIHALASSVILQRDRGKSIKTPLSLEILCDALIHPRITGLYHMEEPALEPITDIVSFFMFCPGALKPSLLKARHFINANGFVPEDLTDDAEKKKYRKGKTVSKAVWREQAISGPFLWAGQFFEEDYDLLELTPDEPESVFAAAQFLDERTRFERFLGVALFCQNKLARLLDPSAAEIRFLEFPKEIKPIDPEIGTFDESQLKIMKGYRAPT